MEVGGGGIPLKVSHIRRRRGIAYCVGNRWSMVETLVIGVVGLDRPPRLLG